MSENDPTYPMKCCSHNKCIEHHPEWEQLGGGLIRPIRIVYPKPTIIERFFQKVIDDPLNKLYSLIFRLQQPAPRVGGVELEVYSHNPENRCCDKPMLHCVHKIHRYCKKCGRKDIQETKHYMFCICCSYKKSFTNRDDYIPNSTDSNYYFGLGGLWVTNEELLAIELKLNGEASQ